MLRMNSGNQLLVILHIAQSTSSNPWQNPCIVMVLHLYFSETRLDELRATLAVPEAGQASGAWRRRQELVRERAKVARPVLLDARLSGQKVLAHLCQKCLQSDAVIRCLDCVPQDREYLCGLCDKAVHRREVFHGRVATFNGFMEAIPPTMAVVLDSSGQPQLCEQGMAIQQCLMTK